VFVFYGALALLGLMVWRGSLRVGGVDVSLRHGRGRGCVM